MEREDKEILLRDLSARLPYGVMLQKIDEPNTAYELYSINLEHYELYFWKYQGKALHIGDIGRLYRNNGQLRYKPYLRPMSSMTEEELKTYHSYCECDDGDFTGETLYFDTIESFDYLASIHIDYRGLIPMGLAIEVTEENNPYKK
jgi:hypothetical protein